MIDIVKISKALSDPIRYKILLMMLNADQCKLSDCYCSSDEGICNCDIMSALGLIQSRVSYHMKELVEAGLVLEKARGKWKYYALNQAIIKEYIKQLEVDFKL